MACGHIESKTYLNMKYKKYAVIFTIWIKHLLLLLYKKILFFCLTESGLEC